MLIIDGHEDLAWSSLALKRDLTLPVEIIRTREKEHPSPGGIATVSLPALREGDVRVVFATIFASPYRDDTPQHRLGYRTPEEAFTQAQRQIEYYHALESAGEVRIIRDSNDLDGVVAGIAPSPGLVLLMEGADPLRSPDDLGWFIERGIKIIGLAWGRTQYSGGTDDPGPLTASGRELLKAMAGAGVTLDVSHMSEEAFWQAIDAFDGRVIASHSNCRSIIPTERHLSDDMITAITERDGVIGLVLYNRFIRPDWRDDDRRDNVTLADLLPHIEHIAGLAGVEHIGLGTDLDGSGGLEVVPKEIETAADLPKLAEVLRNAGLSEGSIVGVMGENWRGFLQLHYTHYR